MNRTSERDDNLLRAIQATARLGGLTLKKVATSDDLEHHTVTITLSGASAGWVQETLDFARETDGLGGGAYADEPQPGLEVVADGDGHVEQVRSENGVVASSDLTEKDETVVVEPRQKRKYTRRELGAAPVGEPVSQHVCRSCGERKDSWAEMVEIGWLCTDCAAAAPTREPIAEVAEPVDQRVHA